MLIYDVVAQAVEQPPLPGNDDWTRQHPLALFSGSMKDCQNYLAAMPHVKARILAHQCQPGHTWIAYDDRRQPIAQVCDACVTAKVSNWNLRTGE